MRAALRLIVERGYERTSLQAIGEEAGYSRGLVSHRFGSKEGLLWAMFERTFGAWAARRLMPRIAGQSGVLELRGIVAASRAALRESPAETRAFYAMLFQSLGPLDVLRPKIAEFHRRQRRAVAARIEAGIAAGTVRADADPAREAALFMSMLRGAAYQSLIDPRGAESESLYDAIDDAVVRLLAPRPGDAGRPRRPAPRPATRERSTR